MKKNVRKNSCMVNVYEYEFIERTTLYFYFWTGNDTENAARYVYAQPVQFMNIEETSQSG